jgi:hypothetical protein
MPRVRLPDGIMENKRLVAKIKYEAELLDVTPEELALAARVSRATLFNRYKRPDEFRLCELKQISRKLRVPLYELLNVEVNV